MAARESTESRLAFWATALPPLLWVAVFFLIPLGVIWAYSFGENLGLTGVSISGTFANYARAFEPLYLQIFAKSVFVAGVTTLLCLIIGFPVALAIVFASERWRPWLLLLVMLPFWTNLLIRTYALIAVLRTEGYVNYGLAWIWESASWLKTLVGLEPLAPMRTGLAGRPYVSRAGPARPRRLHPLHRDGPRAVRLGGAADLRRTAGIDAWPAYGGGLRQGCRLYRGRDRRSRGSRRVLDRWTPPRGACPRAQGAKGGRSLALIRSGRG